MYLELVKQVSQVEQEAEVSVRQAAQQAQQMQEEAERSGTCSSWRPSAAGRRRRTPKQPGSRRCGRFRQTVTPCGSGPGPRCLRR